MSRKETIELEWFTLTENLPNYDTTIIVYDLDYRVYIICYRAEGKRRDYYKPIDGSSNDFRFEEWTYYPF